MKHSYIASYILNCTKGRMVSFIIRYKKFKTMCNVKSQKATIVHATQFRFQSVFSKNSSSHKENSIYKPGGREHRFQTDAKKRLI